jgi:hypothetical protein
MSYTINKSDGSILATVPDGQIDQLSSDITLIGKNYSGFGEALNENFVKLLENFANSSRPERPTRGQIWFDTAESKLKVYTGISFVPVSSATISRTQPLTLGVGDLWFNDVERQLYFFDGTIPILLAPAFSATQGKSGLEVQTILDLNNISRVVTLLYTGGSLLGIFSKDQFIPKIPIAGFNDSGEERVIFTGFNAGTLANLKFNVTAANAEKLNNISAAEFARKDDINVFSQQTFVRTDNGIQFGAANQGLLDIEVGNVRFINTFPNRNMELNVTRGTDQDTAINIISGSQQVKIYEDQPNSLVTMGGNLVVDGNLTVSGTTTTINTEILTLEDKNIELATIPTPTDAYASGGGMIIKGATDHRLIWIFDDAQPGQSNQSWNTEENINIAEGKSYRINGVDILTEAACFVPSFPNVNQLGTQVTLTVDDIFLDDNRIATLNDRNLEIAPSGSGDIVVIGNKKIKGITTTSESFPSQSTQRTAVFAPGTVNEILPLTSDELSESVSKKYVLNLVRRRPIILSLDITDAPSNSAISLLLSQIAKPEEFENGTIARVLCSSQANSTSTLNINPLLNKVNNVEYNTPSGTNFPLQDVTVNPATVPPQAISVFRVVKTFELIAGTWVFQS